MSVQRFISGSVFVVGVVLLAGCSAVPPEQRTDLRDKYEAGNRKVFDFNMGVDSYVLEPVASGYRTVVPEGGRSAVANHLNWASMPSTAINSTLQGKFENAGLATLHFLVNGLTLGFVDLTEDDVPVQAEDFGQTLAAADVPEGSYMMVPVLGPRTTRALVGDVVDLVLNPLGVLGSGDAAQGIIAAQRPVGAVSFRAQNYDAINDVKYNALDPYARTRSVYYQSREGLLEDRVAGAADDADSDDAFLDFLEEDSE